MKKIVAILLLGLFLLFADINGLGSVALADVNREVLTGKTYDVGEKDAYEISKAQEISDSAERFEIEGDITDISEKNGFTSYAVSSGNVGIFLHTQFKNDLVNTDDPSQWHVIEDNTKTVDSTKLSQKIGTGAIIVQTSKDGKTWITSDTETDFNKKTDTINNREAGGESTGAFYRTTNVQLTNGCYYRIIVAYKLQRDIDPMQIWVTPVKIPKTEEKEQIEIYQFYVYDTTVNQEETLNPQAAYEFGDVYRVDSQDGFNNPVLIKSDDPHIDWSVGKFYISGYTDVRMDGDVPVFLKVPGDRAALWFNLEQELDKCNGRTDVKVNYIESGSDIYFGTPTIANFGRGALIVRHTNNKNQKERQIYTNYLEASATVGANTRVDLFEEGDYEVALDYQLHYDKPFVFGRTTTKTLTYRIFFKFKVRNGDISVFLRDVDTNQFITNANVAEHGFYIDVAQSQYLNMTIKREVLTDSLDGLVEDTKFSGVAKEGRQYTEEGIYTVTVNNLATGDKVEKRVYVGDQDVLLAHMKTGLSISEINERIAAGAYVNDQGMIIDPVPTSEAAIETEMEEMSSASDETIETNEVSSESETEIASTIAGTNSQARNQNEEAVSAKKDQANIIFSMPVIIAIVVVLLIACIVGFKKGTGIKKREKEK